MGIDRRGTPIVGSVVTSAVERGEDWIASKVGTTRRFVAFVGIALFAVVAGTAASVAGGLALGPALLAGAKIGLSTAAAASWLNDAVRHGTEVVAARTKMPGLTTVAEGGPGATTVREEPRS